MPSTPLQFRQSRTILLTYFQRCTKISCVVQWTTFTCSAVQSLLVSFGNVQCSSVQISLARCSELTFQFNRGKCSVVQSVEVKLRQRQSSPVRHSAVQFSFLKCFPAQSSPLRRRVLQSSLIRSSLLSGVCSRPAQSSPVPFKSIRSRPIPVIPFHLSTFQSRIAQVHISQQQSSLVQSSAVQSSAIRSSSAVPSRPKQLTTVESSTTQRCSVKLGTTKCIAARPVK